jgi:hypothetical protein
VSAAEIAKALGDAKQEGREWRASCPCHDGRPRLSLRDGDKGLLATCFAGCTSIDILRELRQRGLLDDRPEQREQRRDDPKPRFYQATDADRLNLARWLWKQRRPLPGTLGERYLKEARNFHGAFPCTLGYLAARGRHVHAVVAAFGLPDEPEPGVLALPDSAVRGVQLIRLGDDARKIDMAITIGRCAGVPIVVAPMNDALGLAISEGLEDALSMAEATGLGAWAAGGASRLAALAGAVPPFTDWISLLEDDDPAGRKGVADLEAALLKRKLWRPEQIERVPLT